VKEALAPIKDEEKESSSESSVRKYQNQRKSRNQRVPVNSITTNQLIHTTHSNILGPKNLEGHDPPLRPLLRNPND
jgi:hypothetical protein